MCLLGQTSRGGGGKQELTAAVLIAEQSPRTWRARRDAVLGLGTGPIAAAAAFWSFRCKRGASWCGKHRCSPPGCLPGALQRGPVTWFVVGLKCFPSHVPWRDHSVLWLGPKFPAGGSALVTPAFQPAVPQGRGTSSKWQENVNALTFFSYSS